MIKILKIGAIWCPACLVMQKPIKELLKKYPEIIYQELDIDFDEEKCLSYNAGDILPVIIIYKDNREQKRVIGEKKLTDLIAIVESVSK